jgi:poly-gamma-glutamate synthesis protein (capsule biosynthesis protein)
MTDVGRRRFLARAAGALLGGVAAAAPAPVQRGATRAQKMSQPLKRPAVDTCGITLFLCGDVMTGRGIDQILPHPNKPHLFEPYMHSALGYVELAEQATGPIQRPVDFAYIWGDALAELERMRPDARIVNLETAITATEDAWPGKGIHYRMHPANVLCLTAARIDCCVLANNHVLDWGYGGLIETLQSLRAARIATAGAGRDENEAATPAVLALPMGRRVLIFAFGHESSGVPPGWAARKARAGVNVLNDYSTQTADAIARQVLGAKQAGDIVVASIHWGTNWGFDIPPEQRTFAHRLIDAAGVDVVHGHSSHHPRGIEVYRGKLILHGCGDLLNDYEGINGYDEYRGELALMYFATVDVASGALLRLAMTPTRTRRLRVDRAPPEAVGWLHRTLDREGRKFGTQVERQRDSTLLLRWDEHAATGAR